VIVAEGLLAARIAAPGRDPRTVARPRSPGAGPVDSAAIALEREMVARRRAPAPVADAPAGHEPAATSQLAALRAEFDELRSLIARERDRRRHAEARVAELEEQLSDQQRRAHRAYDVLDALREQLGEVRVAAARAGVAAAPEPPVPPAPEPPRVPETPPAPAASAAGPAERVEPERLAAALSRLRQAADDVAEQAHAAPGDDGPATAVPAPEAPPVRPWLEPVFRALTDRDPAAAGRLAVALLSAQGLVHPDPIAYDVILEETGCLAVSVADGKARVTLIPRSRPAEDVAFQIHGDLARFAKLLVAGRPRWYRRGLAKVTGARAAVETPARLLRRPLTLAQLSEAGVRLTPGMALTLAALMIPPRATGGERFTIAHREPSAATGGAHLHVRDGAVPAVTEGAALEPAEVTIVSPGDELLAVLAGDPAATAEVTGDERALALLREWLNRAQSG
jgi:hypothetical protein